MNLRKFRKATAKKRQLLDKEVYKKKKCLRILEKEQQEETSDLELSETSNTMTLEQFTDIVLASEGVTATSAVNNNNFKEEITEENEDKEAEMEKNAMVATILQNKDLTVEVKTAKSKPIGKLNIVWKSLKLSHLNFGIFHQFMSFKKWTVW